MPKVIESEEYLNTQEVLDELEASKKRFYSNVKPYLRAYHFDAKKTPWYRKRDVLALKTGKAVRKAAIGISGILGDWTVYLRSLGFLAETVDCEVVENVTLPAEAVEFFHLPADKKFVRRSRKTYADRNPICKWDTYYPMEFAGDLVEGMKQGTVHGIPTIIKEKYGLVPTYGKDKYGARITTLDEQNLFQLLADEAVLLLWRVSYAEDKKTLLWYSDMALLGSWFAPEHEYEVHHWKETR